MENSILFQNFSSLKYLFLCVLVLSFTTLHAKNNGLLLNIEGGVNLAKSVRFINPSDANISGLNSFGGKTVISISKDIGSGISPAVGIGYGVFSSRIQTHFIAKIPSVENTDPFVSNFSWIYSGVLLKLGIRKDFILKSKRRQSIGFEAGTEFQMLEMFGAMSYNNSVVIQDKNQDYTVFTDELTIASKSLMPVYYAKINYQYALNQKTSISLNLGYFNAFKTISMADYQFMNVENPSKNSFRLLFRYTNIGIGFHFKLN